MNVRVLYSYKQERGFLKVGGINMKIKNMPRFIFSLTILFAVVSFVTSMFVTKVFSREPDQYENVIVCKGETLWSIASNLNGNINENVYTIKKINNLSNSSIYVGQELLIPIK